MFGSNPFGQSSSSPFGSQPVFGQNNNASSNPFAPKPFGSTSPFGSQTGGSIFGGMSTGVFGAQSSSPLGSTSVFGASSSPAFGSSTPTFGASSGSAFGNSSSAFGGTSVFGQKPTFGGFGSSTTQTSPFGSSFQQTQPAFGSNMFGSTPTPFGAPSQPAFGQSSSPAFGASTTPAFGVTSSPAFGSTTSPAFGSTSGGFGVSSSPFGSSTPAFGNSSTPAFGATSTPAFGTTSTPAFGATSTPAFGATTTPAFGTSATSAFGAPSAPFNFGSSPAFGQTASAFGQTTSAFGSSPFSATSNFGAQTAPFGAQTTTPAFNSSGFGQPTFGGQRGGSRVAPYSATAETEGVTGTQPGGKLESISAMPAYKEKSHEELRWEDYQLGDKGGPAPAGQANASGFGTTNPFGVSSSPAFGQSAANPFSSSTTSNPFASKPQGFSSPAFNSTPTSAFGSSPFATSNTSNLFGSTSSGGSSLFGPTTPTFNPTPSPSPFSASSTSPFGSPSIFGPSSAQGTASTFGTSMGFGNTQSSPLFQSTTPTLQPTSSPFGQTSSAFGQNQSSFGQSNLFSTTPSAGFGNNLFSSTSSLLNSNNTLGFGQTTPSLSTQFQSTQPAPNPDGFNFSNFGQQQTAAASSFGGTPGMFSNTAFGQLSGTQSSVVAQPAPVTNPFGTMPAMPQMSIGRTGNSSIQYGISSLPVVEKPVSVRISPLLTSRHLSQRRIRLPVRKYHPKTDGPKVPFFNDDGESPSTPKADALYVARENPRALVIRPLEQWHSRSGADKTKITATPVHENGKVHQDDYTSTNGHSSKDKSAFTPEESMTNGSTKEHQAPPNGNQKSNGIHDGSPSEKGDSYITLTGHRAGEAAIVYEHGADIEALMPKLRHSDYFTEPRIQELAAKERAEPGFCRHVKDFVVGRNGYGSIKFFGETDVRRLDLESLIQFNNREVIVYMDESKKPPVGQGLNKPAEVTLLNIKCFDKKTGQQCTEGPRIDKYKEMLKRKAEDQGAEFVSYDPIKGEWKFRVNHFSAYKLGDEDEGDENVVCSPLS